MGNGCIKKISKQKTYKLNNEDEQNNKTNKLNQSLSYKIINNLRFNYDVSDVFKIRNQERDNMLVVNSSTTIIVNNNSMISNKTSKFFKKDELSEKILNEINLARFDLKKYSDLIENYSKKIIEENNKSYLLLENGFKFEIEKGRSSLRELSVHLRGIDFSNREKFPVLNGFPFIQEKSELKIPFPDDEEIKLMDEEFITQTKKNLINYLNGKYELVEFIQQLTVNDPKISTILSFLDLINSDKKIRNCLIDRKIRYVGITSKKIDDNIYCLNMAFAK